MDLPYSILISPLDWGLGHAVRDIPIIKELIQHNYRVIIATDNEPLFLLKKEFPNIEYIKFPGLKIKYSKRDNTFIKILFQIPKIIYFAMKEHFLLQKLIKQMKIDMVISDNRYGLFSRKIKSVFITHQINIKLPKYIKFLELFVYKVNLLLINQFDMCLIPDYENFPNLSGDLSHRYKVPGNTVFVGPLTSFLYLKPKNNNSSTIKYDVMFILSGPEPQRSIFENKILSELENINKRVLIVRGKPKNSDNIFSEKAEILNHLSRNDMKDKILLSEIIICRSGYTSVMDLLVLKKKIVFVPTPGQTEQEYLAEYLSENRLAVYLSQSEFKFEKAITKINNFNSKFINFDECKSKSFTDVIGRITGE